MVHTIYKPIYRDQLSIVTPFIRGMPTELPLVQKTWTVFPDIDMATCRQGPGNSIWILQHLSLQWTFGGLPTIFQDVNFRGSGLTHISKVVSIHLWNTPLSLYQRANKGIPFMPKGYALEVCGKFLGRPKDLDFLSPKITHAWWSLGHKKNHPATWLASSVRSFCSM